MQRDLHNRHIQLTALGKAIGTDLFMGLGKTISIAVPLILFVYAIIDCNQYFIMHAMGEFLLSNTQYRSFIDFSTDLLRPCAGFFIGWTINCVGSSLELLKLLLFSHLCTLLVARNQSVDSCYH